MINKKRKNIWRNRENDRGGGLNGNRFCIGLVVSRIGGDAIAQHL